MNTNSVSRTVCAFHLVHRSHSSPFSFTPPPHLLVGLFLLFVSPFPVLFPVFLLSSEAMREQADQGLVVISYVLPFMVACLDLSEALLAFNICVLLSFPSPLSSSPLPLSIHVSVYLHSPPALPSFASPSPFHSISSFPPPSFFFFFCFHSSFHLPLRLLLICLPLVIHSFPPHILLPLVPISFPGPPLFCKMESKSDREEQDRRTGERDEDRK